MLAVALASLQWDLALSVRVEISGSNSSKAIWDSYGSSTACRLDESDRFQDGHGSAKDHPAESLDACKELCLRDEGCQGVAFSSKAEMCRLWSKAIGGAVEQEGSECVRLRTAGPVLEQPNPHLERLPTQGVAEESCPPSICEDGDMVLDEGEKKESLLQTNGSRTRRRLVPWKRWPSNTVVYVWEAGISARAKEALEKAMIEWEAKTCVHFEADPSQTLRGGVLVLGSNRPGCFANVGYDKLELRNLNLGSGCETLGIALHELGHVLGLRHEQQRMDSVKYVEIQQQNIKPGRVQEFTPLLDVVAEDVPYDLASIMHYGEFHFGIDKGDGEEARTVVVTNRDVWGNCKIGQRNYLSTGDILTINRYYGCPDSFCADLHSDCKAMAETGLCEDPSHEEWMEANCPLSCSICMCLDQEEDCPEKAERGLCRRDSGGTEEEKAYMWENCPKSCGRCTHDDRTICKDLPVWGEADGCQKYKDTLGPEGRPYCTNEWFADQCMASCGFCPHQAYCW